MTLRSEFERGHNLRFHISEGRHGAANCADPWHPSHPWHPAGLHGEIGLAKGDFFLARVSVLDNEVTGVAGEVNGGDCALPTLTDLDHFVGADEMILNPLTTVETGGFGLLNDLLEIAVVGDHDLAYKNDISTRAKAFFGNPTLFV